MQLAQMFQHLLRSSLGWCQHQHDKKGLRERGSVFVSETICSSFQFLGDAALTTKKTGGEGVFLQETAHAAFT